MVSRHDFYLVALGVRSLIPGRPQWTHRPTGGTDSARYCYSVWMRHLVMASRNGLTGIPASIAELGPGDSLGIGLAALLSGAEQYSALDVIEYANLSRNIRVFDELIELFRNRHPIPGPDEFPRVKPALDSWVFPDDILSAERIEASLAPDRLMALRTAIQNPDSSRGQVRYITPWDDDAVIKASSIDLIFSQAVLEHVANLPRTYEALSTWLRPGGMMTCQIDFKSHGISPTWDGHWSYGPLIWRLIRGSRPFLLNREPLSIHKTLLRKTGFEIQCQIRAEKAPKLPAAKLARQFRCLSDEDRRTAGVFFVATASGCG